MIVADKIIGNQNIRSLILHTVETGRISHAQLFVAPEGVGALHIAIDYAHRVLGHTGKAIQHPDLHFAFPVNTNKEVKKAPTSDDFMPLWYKFVKQYPYGDLVDWYAMLDIENKQGNISTEEAEAITRKLTLKSYSGGYKVMIIWHGEKMNISAANKLLKLIEEPAPNTLIIILTDDSSSILPTIASRTQQIGFRKISQSEITQELQRNYDIDPSRAQIIASACEGNMSAAIKAISAIESENIFQGLFVRWVRLAFMAKKKPAVLSELLLWADEVAGLPRETQKAFLQYSFGVFRQAMMMNYGVDSLVLLHSLGDGFSFDKFALYIHGGNIEKIYQELDKAVFHIERNANSRLTFFDMSVKITRFLHTRSI